MIGADSAVTFAYPWVFLALPLAFYLFFRRTGLVGKPLWYGDIAVLQGLSPSLRAAIRGPALTLLALAALCAVTIAAARPQRSTPIAKPEEARNLMLALDISLSMSSGDFGSLYGRTTRLAAVKAVVAKFIEARGGDRLGLVVFGNRAYLQAPLTLDHGLLTQVISRLEVGMAGNGTAIGDGLGLGLKRIADLPGSSQAVILLTDGVNNSGSIDPVKAAQVAKDLGIKVHTIGVGSDGIQRRSFAGSILGMVQGSAEFDEATLKQIAALTGGEYFHAADLEGLERVYAEIDQLERSEREEEVLNQVDELYPPFAIAAALGYLALLLLARTVFLKVP